MFTVNILSIDLYIEVMSKAYTRDAKYRFIKPQRAREIGTELLHGDGKMAPFSAFLIALIKSFLKKNILQDCLSNIQL